MQPAKGAARVAKKKALRRSLIIATSISNAGREVEAECVSKTHVWLFTKGFHAKPDAYFLTSFSAYSKAPSFLDYRVSKEATDGLLCSTRCSCPRHEPGANKPAPAVQSAQSDLFFSNE